MAVQRKQTTKKETVGSVNIPLSIMPRTVCHEKLAVFEVKTYI